MRRTRFPHPRRLNRAKILQAILQRAREPSDRGAWLNDNDTFDHGRKLADPEAVRRARVLLEILPLSRQRRRNWEQKQKDIEILCANLLANKSKHLIALKPLAVSLARRSYSPSRYTQASYFVIELINSLHQDGLIGIEKGYRYEKEAKMTRIWPTRKFFEHFTPFDKIDFQPLELVNLRDIDGRDTEYKDTPETKRIRDVLRKANIVNRRAQVQLKTSKGFYRLNTDLYAVFNGSFEHGGRLYTGKGGYQLLTKEERPLIFIDNRPTVELDFSGLQPRLLYALEGIQYNGDPYTVVSDYPELRPFLKQLLLALLNSDSQTKAVASGNQALHLDHDLYRAVNAISHRTAELMERFKKAHPAIAHHFCQRVGLKLMRLDARIALEVVESFTSRDLPILSIHDSFIVQRDKEGELREVMQAAYRKHTGGFTCPIKNG